MILQLTKKQEKKNGLLLIDLSDKDTNKKLTIAAKIIENIDPELSEEILEKRQGVASTEC